MGVSRRMRRDARDTRGTCDSRGACGVRGVRGLAVGGLVAVAMAALVACEPGGLSVTTAAYTTDRTATTELQRQHLDVNWLNCDGSYGGDGNTGVGSTASGSTVVAVECRGETRDGRKITVDGKVTRAVSGACVRGDLTARAAGRQVFHVYGLGDCDATPTPVYSSSYSSSVTRQDPAPTVTVTRTIWCLTDPSCLPVQGK